MMITWLDWYVRSRVMADAFQPALAREARVGVHGPVAVFAHTIFEILATRDVDPDAFAKAEGGLKIAEELAMRSACMAPFLWGFAAPELRKTISQQAALGLVLSRDTASLLSDAEPPTYEWRRLTFGSAPGEDALGAVYVDVPHGALRIGETFQIRTLFAVPMRGHDGDGNLRWDGKVLIHALVTKAGSEQECGSIFIVVNDDDTVNLAAVDEHTPLGGLDGAEVADDKVWVTLYKHVINHAVRFFRVVLAYYRYGPGDAREIIGRTTVAEAMRNKLRPRKTESLFAMTRLNPAKDRLGRASQGTQGSWSLSLRQDVSGHFKLQPYGAGAQLRRLIWIGSYTRGPEDASIRPRAMRL